MRIISGIPFAPDVEAVLRKLRVDSSVDFAAEIAELTERAVRVARPKALFAECFIQQRGEDTVTIEDVTFTSRVLRTNLENVHRVFPFVATCGTEMDELLAEYDDFLLRYALDCLKEMALAAARRHLMAHVKSAYGLRKMSSMLPGSGDADVWPIQQQTELFALIGDVEGAIGVRLKESFLMQPNKTVSGILFPTEVDFVTCRLCHREGCPNRRAPLDVELRRQVEASMD